MIEFSPKGFLHLLFNGSKAVELVETAHRMGLLGRLDRGPATLGELALGFEVPELRLYKFLDCLESLGLVEREPADVLAATRYRILPGVAAAAAAVLGEGSLERDRDRHPWRQMEGKVEDALRGRWSMPEEAFSWPPVGEEQTAAFEQSMSAGIGPVEEAFRLHHPALLPEGARWLDVGGGDGTLACRILGVRPDLQADLYNLEVVRPLWEKRIEGLAGRAPGFVAGDFLAEELPGGYDVISFVRVLHDWPDDVSMMLIEKAYRALRPGGRIVVCEEFRTTDRLAAQFFWSWFLIGVDGCVSRLREVEFYTRGFERVGFPAAEVLPGPWEIVVAEK